jgi:hypothetical protein
MPSFCHINANLWLQAFGLIEEYAFKLGITFQIYQSIGQR